MSNEKRNPEARRKLESQSGAQITEHHTKQVDFLMGRERQKDLLAIACALAGNSGHTDKSTEVLVNMAERILTEIEKRHVAI